METGVGCCLPKAHNNFVCLHVMSQKAANGMEMIGISTKNNVFSKHQHDLL